MKTSTIFLASLALVAATAAAEPHPYHYTVFRLRPEQWVTTPAQEGEADPEACGSLFRLSPGGSGVALEIPTNATAFCIVTITDGTKCRLIPLLSWTDTDGKKRCGFYGPRTGEGHQVDNEDELVKKAVEAVRKK